MQRVFLLLSIFVWVVPLKLVVCRKLTSTPESSVSLPQRVLTLSSPFCNALFFCGALHANNVVVVYGEVCESEGVVRAEEFVYPPLLSLTGALDSLRYRQKCLFVLC